MFYEIIIGENLKAAILERPKKLLVAEAPTPTSVRAGEVIIKIEYAAVCGTDVHLYAGDLPARYPVILGHEYAGRILMVGPRVRNFKPGDRVVGSYVVYCGDCRFCISGKYQLCERRLLFGINIDGSFAQYMKVPLADRVLIKVPDDLELRDAVLIPDMFLTGFCGVEAGVKPGDYVLISGLGGVGLSAAIAAKHAGASLVIGVDMRDKPLELAKQLGMDHVIDARKENVAEAVKKLTDGYGVHVAIEASGAPPAIKSALEAIRPSGKLVQIGIPGKPVELDLKYLIGMEKSIIGVLNPATPIHMERAMNFVKPRISELRKLVTHEYSLDEIVEAMNVAYKKVGDPIKVLIKVAP